MWGAHWTVSDLTIKKMSDVGATLDKFRLNNQRNVRCTPTSDSFLKKRKEIPQARCFLA